MAAIKRLLASGHRAVAVGYTRLYAPYWSRYKSGVITPDEGFVFSVGDKPLGFAAAKAQRPSLVDDVVAGRVRVRPSNPDRKDEYGGHAVTVVGYTLDGFLIKNSWGRGWGMEGYAVVSYDYHRLFCDEALAVKEPVVRVLAGGVQERPTLFLKSRPDRAGTNAWLRLSLFGPREGGLPAMKNLRYEVYEQTAQGARGKPVALPPPSVLTLVGTGNPVDIPRSEQVVPGKTYWGRPPSPRAGS